MRKLQTGLTLLALILSIPALSGQAEQRFFPNLCSINEGVLEVSNPTKNEEAFWLQFDHPHFVEKRVLISAGSTQKIPLSQFLQTEQSFALKHFQPLLKTTLHCDGEQTPGDSTSSLWLTHELSQTTGAVHHLINLSPISNELTLEFYNLRGVLVRREITVIKNYFESVKIKWKKPLDATQLVVKGTGRFNSQLFDQNLRPLKTKALRMPYSETNPNLKYFLASTKTAPFESFVFSLSDQKLIAQARLQITQPNLEKIIVGFIKLGHDNTNRDFHSPGAPPYSWSVEEVTSFADFAHIDCDGSPRLVEERLFERLDYKNSHICFWSYRVVRELSPQEVASGRINFRP